MKILSFSHDGNYYGAQRSLLGLLQGLRRRGHEVALVVPARGPLADAASEGEIPLRILPYPYPSARPARAWRFLREYPGAAAKIRKAVAELRPDLIHFNTAACVAPAAALRLSGTPRVWHLREAAPYRRLLSRLVRRWSDGVIFNCRYIAKAYPLLQNLDGSAVVYNGLDISKPGPRKIEAVREEFGWKRGDVAAAFAGQLRPHKDPMALIEAAARARRAGVPLKACLAGDGPLLAELRSAVVKLCLEDTVSLPGFRDDSLAILAASDIVVCPSLVEPFPRVLLEAMALGLPVVACEVGGIPELVLHGQTGILFAPGDRAALAEALIGLAGDRKRREALGVAGQERHRERFSEDAYAAGVEKAIQQKVTGKMSAKG